MKLEEAYARALFLSIKGKSGDERNNVFKNFFALVSQKGHYRLLARILSAIAKLEKQEVKKNTVMINVTKEGRDTIPSNFTDQFEKNFPQRDEEIFYQACEDPTIIGGFVMKGKSIRLDHSYKNSLLSLYEKIRS